MVLYIPIILICSLSYPDIECREGNKDVNVIIGQAQNTPQGCIKEGYERLSRSAFAPRAEDGYYVKVRCQPRREK